MVEVIGMLVALLCCAIGMSWLALAMPIHWQQAGGAGIAAPASLRLLGSVALLLSLCLLLMLDHSSMAILVWIMATSASALAVAFTLAWRPRTLAFMVPWLPVR